MRLIGAASIVFALALTFAVSASDPSQTAQESAFGTSIDDAKSHRDDDDRDDDDRDDGDRDDGDRRHRLGKLIFRHDTFRDEQLWTDVLRMHEVLATVSPEAALLLASRSTSKLCHGQSSRR